MPEEKKRLPWWLVACAAVLVPLAAVLGFIETVGRRGTIYGRFNEIGNGMSRADVLRILGPPSYAPDKEGLVWEVGLDHSWVQFDGRDRVTSKGIEGSDLPSAYGVGWFVRRWAEKAFTAIHGPRRRAAFRYSRVHFV